LKSVIADFRSENVPDEIATPAQYLAEAQLDDGKPADAQKTLEALRDKAGNFPNYNAQADYELASGKIADPGAHLAPIEKILADKKFTEFESRLEIRLVLAKLELLAGRPAEARMQLLSVQRDADAKGYGLWSQKAAVLLKKAK
jgi:ATP/maltotriose-dependent transcriptional regulator MalT